MELECNTLRFPNEWRGKDNASFLWLSFQVGVDHEVRGSSCTKTTIMSNSTHALHAYHRSNEVECLWSMPTYTYPSNVCCSSKLTMQLQIGSVVFLPRALALPIPLHNLSRPSFPTYVSCAEKPSSTSSAIVAEAPFPRHHMTNFRRKKISGESQLEEKRAPHFSNEHAALT